MKITNGQLREIVNECVSRIMTEGWQTDSVPNKEYAWDFMANAIYGKMFSELSDAEQRRVKSAVLNRYKDDVVNRYKLRINDRVQDDFGEKYSQMSQYRKNAIRRGRMPKGVHYNADDSRPIYGQGVRKPFTGKH